MNMDSTFLVPTHVVAKTVGIEVVILDLEGGTYFGLDPIGGRMWGLVSVGKSLAETCDVMLEKYNISREVLERDMLTLARELADKKLICNP